MTQGPVLSAVFLESLLPSEGRRQTLGAENEEGFREPAERTAHPGLLGSQKVKPRFRDSTGYTGKRFLML